MTSTIPPPAPVPGAVVQRDGRCRFTVWAPLWDRVDVRVVDPDIGCHPLKRDEWGYHQGHLEGLGPGTRYLFRLGNEKELPDPASRWQPEGVHGPSAVVDPRFEWKDGEFRGIELDDLVLYELHVGTFSREGTFEAVIPRLDVLKDLGVTALELMPVTQFSGTRNWGYDGVFPFAVQDSYGGIPGLQRLVDACHQRGLAVVLDVVYNHLGPEGNVLGEYAPYFTDRYRTPWGAALNFDGPGSDPVRHYFIQSALYFMEACHIDAFRLDAIHGICDSSAYPFLQELAEAVHRHAAERGRIVHLIAESDLNDSRVIKPVSAGGLGLDAQWSDDFHHALHALLTGERAGYYRDFGSLEQLARAYREGFVYDGRFSAYRNRRHGNSLHGCRARQLVVSLQNHDQIGNRAQGDRLTRHCSSRELRLAACALLLSPYLPLLFMGEEYGETAPFQYFTSHSDPRLAEAVRQGRRREFAAFGWNPEEIPDPQAEATYARCRLQWDLSRQPSNARLCDLYRELLRLRKQRSALRSLEWDQMETTLDAEQRVLEVQRWSGTDRVVLLLAFGDENANRSVSLRPGAWETLLDTESPRWGGGGSSVGERFDSKGEVTLKLWPKSALVMGTALEE